MFRMLQKRQKKTTSEVPGRLKSTAFWASVVPFRGLRGPERGLQIAGAFGGVADVGRFTSHRNYIGVLLS